MPSNERLVPLLQELVRIPSYVDKQHNEAAITKFIASKLSQNPDLVIESQPVRKGRQNLIAYDRSKLPQTILFGHMDTVRIKKETADPFSATINGDRLSGLGAMDMKSGLSIMIDTALNAHQPNIGYVFSVDEEYDFLGALKLRQYKKFHPDTIINIEPTNNLIVNGCRGITEFKFNVHGVAVHAGRKKEGVNAIEKAVAIGNDLQQEVSKYDDSSGMKSSVNIAELHGGLLEKQTNTGRFVFSNGGSSVPNFAQVNCEIRLGSPRLTEEQIKNSLQKIGQRNKAGITDINFRFHFGSMHTPVDRLIDFEQAIKRCGQSVGYGNINDSGYYEVQMLQEQWGGRAIIYGAGPSNKCHTADEYVDINSLQLTDQVIKQFIQSTL